MGGDGSIMRVSHAASLYGIPILGVNLGRVGYMAELEVNEFSLIDKYFKGEYTIEPRMMLSVVAPDDSEHLALNDLVLSNGTVSKMVTFSLYNNNDLVRRYNADGIIISTPTGSTAYSMAAGGSIIDPGLNCIAATPVCPHSLSAKPMIFSGDAKLKIVNETERDIPVFITVDGGDNLEIKYEETVKVCRSSLVTKLVRIKNESFYRTLANKME
ncbi:MAG: NAD(+)/NADH kinase [Clostridia bacterium]|nr:NAD(+)/NADH kinase [Clostridia bacterium]